VERRFTSIARAFLVLFARMERPTTTLVIPGKNCARTIAACLDAVVPLVGESLAEIIFVDDASTDDTAQIVARYPVRSLKGRGDGPAAARNVGWRAARTAWIWFIDSDCVAEEDALAILLSHAADGAAAGVGGSYGNMRPDSLLACLIHEEIAERHSRMPSRVDFLGSFNVLYKREALEEVGGFDQRYVTAEDADLSYRLSRAGYALAFDARSRVKHFHPDELRGYLKTQARHGYWRVALYAEHPSRTSGDAYSGFSDHVQPVLALGSMALAPFSLLVVPALLQIPIAASLAAAQIPMTSRLVSRTGSPRYAAFAALSYVRAYARGAGLAKGAAHSLRRTLFGEKGGHGR
jgi:glycosyltransferase involved in cell wall biosynthesis